MKNGIDEAFDLGATSARVFSGKYPGEDKKEEAKKILIDSLKEICEYANEQGEISLFMKVFDFDIDKGLSDRAFQGRRRRGRRSPQGL